MATSMLPTQRSKVNKTLRVLVIAFVSYGLTGVSPWAFFYIGAGTPGTEPRAAVERTRDPFFDGPKFLKVLYETGFMDVGGTSLVRGLRALEEETNTKIRHGPKGDWFPHDGKRKKVITFAGEAEDILAAYARLSSTDMTEITTTFLVPNSAARVLIGTNGENITKMKETTSANIYIQNVPKLTESKLIVAGSPQSAMDVAEWIMSVLPAFEQDVRDNLGGGYLARNADKPAKIYVMLADKKQVGWIIGKGGSTLAKLKEEYFLDIEVDSKMNILKLEGAIGDVHTAHEYINSAFIRLSEDAAGGGNP
eukprot:TRINITY_DN2028_c0_g1_i1.p1 TRINITY_DN2028_c0_g1~~TRINITY_DN2028_c0_g1_i1.p1  ORF type:complete len:327 (+),score=55.45 TRINITY_DN2028_c0_g1_i1:59-982(+)